jgi:hypothetical protein
VSHSALAAKIASKAWGASPLLPLPCPLRSLSDQCFGLGCVRATVCAEADAIPVLITDVHRGALQGSDHGRLRAR